MTEAEFGKKMPEPITLALGFFDSIHKGHRLILERAKLLAQKSVCSSAVMTFANNPYIKLDKNTGLVYTYAERKILLQEIGIDVIIKADFDDNFMKMPAQMFIDKLFSCCNIKHIVCGYDYKFGYNALGGTDMLTSCCKKYGIGIDILPEASYEGKKISSTLIRNLISSGEIEKANLLLEKPYFIQGRVGHGKKIGSRLVYPTINIEYGSEKLAIGSGVYYTQVETGGGRYKSVTNCGSKPTFKDNTYTVETYILDFSGDIYGNMVNLYFYRKIRDTKEFENPELLKEQIAKDIEKIRSFGEVL